ncbi:MAG TPA: HemK/PrmC family methyltransferase [Candidatus Saccharimonadales bacterium]
MTNIQTCLVESTRWLEKAGIGTARLDVLVLLEYTLDVDRAWLLAHGETPIEPQKLLKLKKLLKRRARHEPLSYVRGKTEFYGREFVLTPAVLEPRPESETMIELFRALPLFAGAQAPIGSSGTKSRSAVHVADVGTGSGALGITASLEVPKVTVDLLDIDREALQVAKTNVDKFTLSLSIVESDLLAGTNGGYDVLLCNLPYVPDDYQINTAAMHEPKLAIFGGPDGLDLYRKLFRQVSKQSKQPLYILTEALPPQHAALEQIASKAGYELYENNDFIQVFKCIQKSVSDSLK